MISDYLSFDHYTQVNQLLFLVPEQNTSEKKKKKDIQYDVPEGFEVEINQSQQH